MNEMMKDLLNEVPELWIDLPRLPMMAQTAAKLRDWLHWHLGRFIPPEDMYYESEKAARELYRRRAALARKLARQLVQSVSDEDLRELADWARATHDHAVAEATAWARAVLALHPGQDVLEKTAEELRQHVEAVREPFRRWSIVDGLNYITALARWNMLRELRCPGATPIWHDLLPKSRALTEAHVGHAVDADNEIPF